MYSASSVYKNPSPTALSLSLSLRGERGIYEETAIKEKRFGFDALHVTCL